MKRYLIVSLVMLLFVIGVQAAPPINTVGVTGPMTVCLTMEQTQAAANQKLAASIKVTNVATQQQQASYQQLATYYQQLDKDNQQKAKDIQQLAKDKQQIAQDIALKAKEVALIAREKECEKKLAECLAKHVPAPEVNPWKPDGKGGYCKTQNGEKWTCNSKKEIFIDEIPLDAALKMKGEAAYIAEEDYNAAKEEHKKTGKTNRSGGGDGTNPGGGGNINGVVNPGNANHVEKGKDDKATGVPVSKK